MGRLFLAFLLFTCSVVGLFALGYLVFVFGLVSSCLGGQGRGPCPVPATMYLLIAGTCILTLGGFLIGGRLVERELRSAREVRVLDILREPDDGDM
jgi:hypothetical protein